MNEIEKMYKLANVAKPVIKKWYYDGYYEDFSWQSSEEDCTELLKYFDNSIDKLNDRIQQMKKEENTKYDRYTDSVDTEFGRVEKAYIKYPQFTVEKQVKVTLKLWEFRLNIYPDFDLLVNHSYGEIIATFVNNLWQDLAKGEKEQIRNILEG